MYSLKKLHHPHDFPYATLCIPEHFLIGAVDSQSDYLPFHYQLRPTAHHHALSFAVHVAQQAAFLSSTIHMMHLIHHGESHESLTIGHSYDRNVPHPFNLFVGDSVSQIPTLRIIPARGRHRVLSL